MGGAENSRWVMLFNKKGERVRAKVGKSRMEE